MKLTRYISLSFLTLLDLIFFPQQGKCANILSIFPIPSKSHDILGSVLSKHLANIGHNVTYISAFPHEEKLENFYSIQLENMDRFKANMKKYIQGKATKFDIIKQVFKLGELAEIVFEDKDVQKLINSNSHFDLVIHLMGLDGSLALAHHFKAPLIIFVPISAIYIHNKILANPSPSSYIPTIVTPYNHDMSFFERVSNVIIPFLFFNSLEIVCNYYGNEAIKKYLNTDVKLEDIRKNVDLILINSHISTESPRPYVPNMIQIGGFHLQKPEILNEDLKEILDGAKNGFIYVSFGSNVIVKDLPESFLNILKETLKNLPYKIIMKYEDDFIINQPDNFHLQKWFPQPSVLAYPNIKLFITHGGYGGITESLYNGVPLICIPFFSDQWKNCIEAEYNGYGILINWENVDEITFSESLKKVLWVEKFKRSISFKSDLYKNQIINPMENAVYWIEHVIKYKSGKHLRVKGVDLPWYQYYLIDVIIFLGIIFVVILFSLLYSCKFIFGLCCKSYNKLKVN